MIRINRLDPPVEITIEIQKEKSHRFADARLNNPSRRFQWATINGK